MKYRLFVSLICVLHSSILSGMQTSQQFNNHIIESQDIRVVITSLQKDPLSASLLSKLADLYSKDMAAPLAACKVSFNPLTRLAVWLYQIYMQPDLENAHYKMLIQDLTAAIKNKDFYLICAYNGSQELIGWVMLEKTLEGHILHEACGIDESITAFLKGFVMGNRDQMLI